MVDTSTLTHVCCICVQLHHPALLPVQARNPHQSRPSRVTPQMTPLSVFAATDTTSHQWTTGSSVSSVSSGFMTVVDRGTLTVVIIVFRLVVL